MSEKLTSGRELDALIAENLMGWTDVKQSSGVATGTPPGINLVAVIPYYSSDEDCARFVEDKIEEMGLQEDYASALLGIIDPDGARIFSSAIEVDVYGNLDEGWKVVWALIRATPEQRCRAALAAVEK